MFWRFGFNGNNFQPNIDTLLSKEDVTLSAVLSEEDVLQEIKTSNEKLIKFILGHKKEFFEFLFVSIPKTEDMEAELKICFIAGEIMLIGNSEMLSEFADEKDCLDFLYKVSTYSSEDMIPLLANNIFKVVASIINYSPSSFLEFLKSKPDYIGHLIRNIEFTGILDTILKIMTSTAEIPDISESNSSSRTTTIADFVQQHCIVGLLLDLFDPSLYPPETHSLASICIIEMIALYHTSDDLDEDLLNKCSLIRDVKGNESATKLCKLMFSAEIPADIQDSEERRSSIVINGINIFIELIRRSTCSVDYDSSAVPGEDHNSGFSGELANLPPPPPNIKRNPLDTTELLNVLFQYVPHFKNLLVNKEHIKPIATTLGSIVPLTALRLTVVELFAELLRVQTDRVFKVFLEHKIFHICIDLFYEFPWNNLLHMVVCDLCDTLLDLSDDDKVSSKMELIKDFFLEVNIVQKILDGIRKNEAEEYKKGGIRIGYMGHLTIIVGKILDFIENNKDEKFFQAIRHCFSEEWDEYVRKGYKVLKEKEGRALGSISRSHTSHNAPIRAVDVDTDQLARYMVSQIVSGFPSIFSNGATSTVESEMLKRGLSISNSSEKEWTNIEDPFFVADTQQQAPKDSDDDSDEDPFKTNTSDPFRTTEVIVHQTGDMTLDPFSGPPTEESQASNAGWANFDNMTESSVQNNNQLKSKTDF